MISVKYPHAKQILRNKFCWLLLGCNGHITIKGIFSVVILKINKVNFYGASTERIKHHETQSWRWKRLPKIEDITETQRYNEPLISLQDLL